MTDYTPLELSIKRRKLALEYSQKMKQLAGLKKKRALDILPLIAEHKSVAKADRYYDATEDGQKIIELEYYTKGLIETMRAVKTEVELKQAEAFGQY
jgi:hypothetical protein